MAGKFYKIRYGAHAYQLRTVWVMKHLSLFALFLLLPLAVSAQETVPIVEGQAFAPQPGASTEPSPNSPAQIEIRFTAIENEMRILRGKNEEHEFQIRKLTETIEKMQRDVDMRFSDLSSAKPAALTPPSAPKEHTDEEKSEKAADAKHTLEKPPAEKAPEKAAEEHSSGPSTAGDGVLKLAETSGDATPRDLYNAAFRLLNQSKYSEAGAAFDAFTKKYPKDPLVGNAYYWQGETYYIRRDYVAAADNFREGFEALPTGPKAPDNLLKLAMSLDALKRDKEACIVLSQIVTKFKKGAISVSEKAASEQKRMGCK